MLQPTEKWKKELFTLKAWAIFGKQNAGMFESVIQVMTSWDQSVDILYWTTVQNARLMYLLQNLSIMTIVLIRQTMEAQHLAEMLRNFYPSEGLGGQREGQWKRSRKRKNNFSHQPP